MRFGNIKIFMMALLTIAKTERPTPKNLKILKNKLYFCFKYQSKLRKIAYNIYPAIQQVKLKKKLFQHWFTVYFKNCKIYAFPVYRRTNPFND